MEKMEKIKNLLDKSVISDRKTVILGSIAILLAGIVIGMLVSPRRSFVITGDDAQQDDEEE